MKYKIKNTIEKEWNGKKFTVATLVDTEGKEYPNISAWGGEFKDKDEIECELEKNAKGYWAMKKKQRGNAGFKQAQIEKSMDKKAQQIEQAQDRSAWMWAKNNASLLVAHRLSNVVPKSREELADEVIELATLIYNGEPTKPF